MLSVVTAVSRMGVGQRLTVPVGLIDDFDRDDGWLGDRVASCGNVWETGDPDVVPAYLASGVMTSTPGEAYNAGGTIWLGGVAAGITVTVDVTNSGSSRGDQNYWVIDLLRDPPEDPRGRNLQLEVSQRNCFVVYYAPGATFPAVYASGAGSAYGASERWYFTATPGASSTTFVVQKSSLSGTGLVTVCSGNTGTDRFDGPCMTLGGGPDVQYLTCSRTTAPRVPHSETFNAADNYPTGPIVTDGITWTIGGGAGNYGRSGGNLFFDGHDSDAFNTAAVVMLECGSGDGTVTATAARNTASTYGTGLAWRQSASGTFWFIETSAGGTHGQGAVRRAVGGHTTGTTYLSLGALPDNATLSVSLAGPLMTFYVNGTNVGTVTDSTDATASKHGVASDRGGGFGSVDSFTYA